MPFLKYIKVKARFSGSQTSIYKLKKEKNNVTHFAVIFLEEFSGY